MKKEIVRKNKRNEGENDNKEVKNEETDTKNGKKKKLNKKKWMCNSFQNGWIVKQQIMKIWF